MGSIARTLEFLRPYRWWLALAVGLTVLVTVMQIIPPRPLHYAFGSGIKPALAAGQRLSVLEDPGIHQDMFYERFKSVLDRPAGA